MMKAKPRWMKSVIETAAKYAHSNAADAPRDTVDQENKSTVTDQA